MNLWEYEDLKEDFYPPGDFTFEEPDSLETTLTSTWLVDEEPNAQRRCLQYPVHDRVNAKDRFLLGEGHEQEDRLVTKRQRLNINLLGCSLFIHPTLWQIIKLKLNLLGE